MWEAHCKNGGGEQTPKSGWMGHRYFLSRHESVQELGTCAKLFLFTWNWHQTVSFYWKNDVILREREKEREREREGGEWPVPKSRWAFERSVTCLYLENRISIVLIVYVLFGCIHRLCPYKHIFLFSWSYFYRWIHVFAIGLYMYCWYYAWVLFDGILLSAGLCIVQYSLSWKIFDDNFCGF